MTGGPDGEDVEFHFVTPSPPPPLSTPPPLVGGAPRPCTAEAASLCAGLLELLAAQQAHCTAPDRGLLWVRRRPAAPARPRGRPDPLAPPPSSFPPPARAPPPPAPSCGAGTIPGTLADGLPGPAPHTPLSWRGLLGGEEVQASQRDFSLPAHAAARARIYAELSLWQRAGLAACQGHGAAAWLSALPSPGVGGAAIPGVAMRTAVRLWLGVAPRSVPPAARCRCGAAADAAGRHFLAACPEQRPRHARLHHHVVHLVAEALRRAEGWGEVAVEVGLDTAPASLRPDFRATREGTGEVTWADVSVASPFSSLLAPMAADAPLEPVAAATREGDKVRRYARALPVGPPSHTFTPLVWEVYGRLGPASAAWLREALGGPRLATARARLLTAISVALWKSNARAVADGYARCFGVEDPIGGGIVGPLGSSRSVARIGD